MESLIYFYEQKLYLLTLKYNLSYIHPSIYKDEYEKLVFKNGQLNTIPNYEWIIEYHNGEKVLNIAILPNYKVECIYVNSPSIFDMSDVDNPTNKELLNLYRQLIN